MAQILIADDEEVFRNIIKKSLEIAGHKVLEAGNGREALESFEENPSDVVIIDLVMPEKEGIETIIEFRQNFPDVKIIAMSGSGENSPHLEMARHLGANAILDKPFYIEVLIETVNSLITNKSERIVK